MLPILRPRRSLGRATVTICAAITCAGLLLAGCGDSSTALSARQKVVDANSTGVAMHQCGAACTGVIDGAKYTIKLPSSWNGTLLLYSHGYRFAASAPSEPGPVETQAQVSSTDSNGTGTDPLSKKLLSEGYALAGSSYDSNGWAVADGVKAGEQLHAKFASLVGTPRRTYVWGDSLGGLITELISEDNPQWVDGAAPMCGAVAGPNLNFDLALDVAYAVKTLIDPTFKLTGYTSAEDAGANWTQAAKAVEKAAADIAGGGTAKILLIAALVNAPSQTETYDGHDLTSTVKAKVEALLTALAFGTSGRYEIEQRVGGNPSTNAGTDYATRIDANERAAITTAGGNVPKLLAKLAAGTRVSADAAARAKFEGLGDTTGKLTVPTLTMHTEADPLVVVQNENVFAQRVQAQGRSGDLVQLFIKAPARYSEKTGAPYGAGHCVFSDGERVGLIQALDSWVRHGVYPVAAGLSAEIGPGLDPTYVAQPWPAAT